MSSLGFDEILLKNIDGRNQKTIELLAEMNTDNILLWKSVTDTLQFM